MKISLKLESFRLSKSTARGILFIGEKSLLSKTHRYHIFRPFSYSSTQKIIQLSSNFTLSKPISKINIFQSDTAQI
ncbi:TPA: hypothetical protein DEG21_03835 [Patescibacteria group bacterium]|nr:hypothetical protein [Candidatus Gracilibacteria bacterium]HBY74981.1 hypothetical protein [Candidatus Gracilibacteria bacterium]